MITEDLLNRLALIMCMKAGYRYLECLNYLAIQNQMFIDRDLLKQVRKDFLDYRKKMLEAGFEVKLDTMITASVDSELKSS